MIMAAMLVCVIGVGCGGSPASRKSDAGQAETAATSRPTLPVKPTVRYKLEKPDFQVFAVRPTADGPMEYQLLASKQRIFVIRREAELLTFTNNPPEFGVLPLAGGNKITFQSVDAAVPALTAKTWRQYYAWFTAGDRLFVQVGEKPMTLSSKESLLTVELYPQQRIHEDVAAVQFNQVASADGEVVGEQSDGTVYVMDEDLHVKQQFKPKGLNWQSQVAAIGGGQVLIGDAPFDLKSGDYLWDASGATKRTFPAASDWKAAASDPFGLVWFAKAPPENKLRLVASTRDGEIVADVSPTPHQLSARSSVALIPTEEALIVAVIGKYQGEDNLLIYRFKRA